jgi:hypothetical protein
MRRDEKEKRVNVSKNQWTRDKSERKVTVTFDGQTSVYVRLPLMGVLGVGCISDLLNAPVPLILIYTGHVILVSGRRRENRHFASWYLVHSFVIVFHA